MQEDRDKEQTRTVGVGMAEDVASNDTGIGSRLDPIQIENTPMSMRM